MTVVDPSGNDDHGRMPVTSVDRPWITRGVSHATLEGRPPTTTITRQEIPRWNHLFLPRNAREREKVSVLAEKKKKKKKEKSESSTEKKYDWLVSKCSFFGMAPAWFYGWSY